MDMDDMEKRIRLEAMITEREAMMAMNAQRERNNDSQAYGEDAFFRLSDRMMELLK
jgi:hypothetical protein